MLPEGNLTITEKKFFLFTIEILEEMLMKVNTRKKFSRKNKKMNVPLEIKKKIN